MITKTVSIEITPEEAAALFCEMTDEQQAIFLNEVGRLSNEWISPAEFQFAAILSSGALSKDGLSAVKKMAENIFPKQ